MCQLFSPRPELHVVPDECSYITKLVHNDLSVIMLGPFGKTGTNVYGDNTPIIHDIVNIVGCATVALKGSMLNHVHCKWLMPVGHLLPMSYFIGNKLGSLSSGQINCGSNQIGCWVMVFIKVCCCASKMQSAATLRYDLIVSLLIVLQSKM